MADVIFPCPHLECGLYIQVLLAEINCAIFRHGASGNQALAPHAPEAECRAFMSRPGAVGCGRPFQLVRDGDAWVARVCGYI